jgi:hypothetical protein
MVALSDPVAGPAGKFFFFGFKQANEIPKDGELS